MVDHGLHHPQAKLPERLAGKGKRERSEAPVEVPVEAPVDLSATDQAVLRAVVQKPVGRSALLGVLGYTQRTGNFKKALEKLNNAGLIAMTIPGKPNSRLQKYRLTPKGQAALAIAHC